MGRLTVRTYFHKFDGTHSNGESNLKNGLKEGKNKVENNDVK